MPSPSPSPDCRVAAPEWSRLLSGRGSVVRDETMLPRAARPPPPASRCVLTAFFFYYTPRETGPASRPAQQRQILPGNRFPALRLAPPIRGPDGGGGAPEGWSRPSVAGTIRAWTAPLRAKWSTGRRDWVNLVLFFSCARGPGQRGVALPSLPSKAAIVSRLQSVCVASPQNGTGPKTAGPLDRLLSRWPRTRLLDI